MKHFSFLLLLFAFMVTIPTYGQEHENFEVSEEENKFVITLTPSFTWVPKGAELDNLNDEGHFTPSLGVDFFYRLNHRWEIGAMFDYNFDHYIIPRKNDLERENAFVAALMFAYTFNPRWNMFGGAGMEFDGNENIPLARLGVEYVIPMKNDWFIPIGAFVDWLEGYSAGSFSFGIGKSF